MDAWHGPDKKVGKDLVKGTLVAGLAGATAGTTIGILRQQPVMEYAISGGLNASLFGMTFIGIVRGKNPYYGLKDSQTMDIDHLWSSTVAGACTGGILSALARGPKAVPSGTFMFGAMALGGQLVLTKANRYRQDVILETTPLEGAIVQAKRARDGSQEYVGTGLLKVLPVHRTDVDDYEKRLIQKLELIEREQRVLEEELPTASQSRPSVSPSSSPSKRKREQDVSKPPVIPKSYRPRPSMAHKFERPNTRRFRSSDGGTDKMKSNHMKGVITKMALPEQTTAPIQKPTKLAVTINPDEARSVETTDQPRDESVYVEHGSNSISTIELSQIVGAADVDNTNIKTEARALKDVSSEDEPSNNTISEISTLEVTTPGATTLETITPDTSTTPDTLATPTTPTTPTTEPSTPEINGIKTSNATPTKISIAPQDSFESPETAINVNKSMPTPVAPVIPAIPTTPVQIPAQIAVVEASPSKRVAFSPNKQESRFSSPNMVSISKLKSILKPVPLRIEDSDLMQYDCDEALPIRLMNTGVRNTSYLSDNSTDAESFVKAAIASLESEDLQLRASAYTELQAKLRSGDDKPYLDVTIVTMFTPKETEFLVTQILHLINATNEKPTCNLAIWSFTSAKIPPRVLIPFVPQMMKAFLDNLDSRFKSSSITGESLSFPSEILPHVQEWLVPVIMRLVSSVPGIRSRALELLTTALPKLIEKDDPRRTQVVNKFMKDHSTDFFGLLTQNFLDEGDEVYAITVWGAMVTLAGRLLQKYSNLNPMLKMAEKCFNSTSSKRTEIKMAAFQAWTRLIYNFSIGGHIASEKPLKLMMTPIKNCFLTERHKRVRLACTNTWIALIYALGPKLSKNAEQVLFPLLKLAIADDSEHIRDLALRLLVALFSNTGGQDLVEGRHSIVPGTITFSDLGWADATWVRTELLDHGLDYIFQTVSLQHKIPETGREDWRKLGLTELPLLTQRCARTWEGVVRAIRDINLQEKGMRATAEANRAVSSLLFFVDKVSRCDPKVLFPKEWPLSDPEKISLLKLDPNMAGFIVRADIVYYFYACVIDIFSARALVTTRYRVKDSIHADLYGVIVNSGTSQEDKNVATSQYQGAKDVSLSPLEYILKSWLATGESVIETALEDPFWQAVAFFVEMFTKGISALRPLYKCLDHMEDIKMKRQTTSDVIWPPYSKGPVAPMTFRIFQCKYWAIVAQRLGATMEKANEITDDVSLGDQHGFEEFFGLMTYPFSILNELHDARHGLPDMDHSQRVQESQDIEAAENRTQYIITFEATSLPAWTGLLRSFYNVAQHKRSNANAALNTLASRIQECYDKRLPFVWIQSLSIAFASVIVETVVLTDTNPSFQKPQSQGAIYGLTPNRHRNEQPFDNLLKLCSFLFEEAYNGIENTKDLIGTSHIPRIQEAAFLLMEKVINKAPPSLIMQWFHSLQHSIIRWVDDPLLILHQLPKASRQLYRIRINIFWNHCVIRKLLGLSTESRIGGPKSAFGSVLPPPISTIRGAVQQRAQTATAARDSQTSHSPSKSPTVLPNPFLENDIDNVHATEVYDSEVLALLMPLLFSGLNSHHKSIVNTTLEFWNKSFGLSKKDLDYPQEIVSIMQQLKLVATISLPGWSFEDSSQTEVPQFASLSQEILSLPSELNVRTGLSRLLKQKAKIAKQLSPRKGIKRQQIHGLENVSLSGSDAFTPINLKGTGAADAAVAAPIMDDSSSSNYSSNNNSRASTPGSWATPNGNVNNPGNPSIQSKIVSGDHPNENDRGDDEVKELSKRKIGNSRTVHSLEMDPVRRILVAKTSEVRTPESGSDLSTLDDSEDDVSKVSSPSKRAKRMNAYKEDEPLHHLPTAPIWKPQSPLKLHSSLDDESASSLLDSGVGPGPNMDFTSTSTRKSDITAHKSSMVTEPIEPSQVVTDKPPTNATPSSDSQGEGDAFSIMPAQSILSNPMEDVEPTSLDDQDFIDINSLDNEEMQNAAETLNPRVNILPSGKGATVIEPKDIMASVPETTARALYVVTADTKAGDSMFTDVDSNIRATVSAAQPPIVKDAIRSSIDSKDDFAVAVQRLVEARGVVNQMNMRQLVELQNQLMTLNQAVCSAWSQFVKDKDDNISSNSQSSQDRIEQ
ncbi:DNA-binding protein rif1 [Mortierella sp. AM989]|nr:DNA-binding protein rif1 [Mortierella sp. AM989]